MSWLVSVLGSVALWVGGALLLAAATIIGPGRLRELRGDLTARLWRSRHALAALGLVLVASAVGRSSLQVISRLWGLQLTGLIYAIEGEFVGWIQATFATPELTVYFSGIYVYGYAFLLSFPFLAYLALPRTETLRRLLVAYAFNYAIGLAIYTLVFAHGPRNLDVATSLLVTYNPDFTALTSEINEATNVFPSLHTSLSVTVATFAVLTRKEYPAWTPIALWLSTSVVIATMYLGIHWLIDVIGGIVLALGSVYLSYRYVEADDADADERDAEPVRPATPNDE
ncbi:phosphatase PAP2 family protein [Halorubrum sp. AD140]|uniref:phosphatase PAP2 family protein n=1 Tax=Halorubrum sp. AD140 TaxID=3050073 RepID=UPI002ACC7E5E|nr:phosphatase PAP2 family protein [Halorubrum sp. AD140]MDZ5811343.1 phosphatase PAP2 family protein [Halorubrum sp. AD140]